MILDQVVYNAIVELNDPPDETDNKNAAFIWKGLDHTWLRTFLKCGIPHRISRLVSTISEEIHRIENAVWNSEAFGVLAQSTGVDGNFMKPKIHFGIVQSENVFIGRGSVNLKWLDQSDRSEFPKAISEINHEVVINLEDRDDLKCGLLDNYNVILRGIQIDTKGPNDEEDGMWPYKIYVQIHDCQKTEQNELKFNLIVTIGRAWTPHLGGTGKFVTKPFRHQLKFDINVDFTVIGGNESHINFTHGNEIRREGLGHNPNPIEGFHEIIGTPELYEVGLGAITGFGFEFQQYREARKHNHLGRYIKSIVFKIKDQAYENGKLTLCYKTKVGIPKTVVNTKIQYVIHPLLIQFNEANITKNRTRTSSLCVNSSGAPWFSKWTNKGGNKRGPVREKVVINLID